MNHLNLSTLTIFLLCFLLQPCRGASSGENLLRNGSFEESTGGVLSGWSLKGDEGVKQRLSQAAGVTSGHSARLECTSFTRHSRDSYATIAQSGLIAIESGKWYRFSCWARQEGMASAMVTTEWTADQTATIPYNTTALFYQMNVGNQWRHFEWVFPSYSTGTENSILTLYFDDVGTLWLDDVRIVEVDPPQPRYVREVPPRTQGNLLRNASFECGPDHWSSVGTDLPAGSGVEPAEGYFYARGAYHGEYCLRLDLEPAPVERIQSDVPPWPIREVPRNPLISSLGFIPVKAGESYTLSAYLRADQSDVPAKLVIHFLKPFGGHPIETHNVTLTTKWERYAFTTTASSDYAFVQVGPDLTGRPKAAATVWIDALQLEMERSSSAFQTREPLEIGLNTGRYGNIFTLDQARELTIQACNRSLRPTVLTLAFTIRDYFDREVSHFSHRLTVPPETTLLEERPLPLARPGYYRLHASWEAGGRHHDRSIRLSVIEEYKERESIFGVNNAPGNNLLCGPLRLAGVNWVRRWTFSWERIEPAPGQFEFETADFEINRLLEADMQILNLLPPFPSTTWNTTAPEGAKKIAPDYGWGTNFYAPTDLESMKRFIGTTVNRYKDRLHTWEYLNEPFYTIHSLPNKQQMDATIPTLPGADYTVDDYIRLLQVFNTAVKKADSTARTIGGMGARPDLLTREFFEAGGLDHLDIFNIHIYPGLREPEFYIGQMQQMLHWMDASPAGRKPIWLTEYSYFGTDDLPWEPYVMNAGPWAPNRLLRDEKECSDYTVRFNAIMLAHGVEKIFYHSGHVLHVSLNNDVWILEAWMNDYASKPRKLYAAQAAMANLLGPAPEYAAALKKPKTLKGNDTTQVHGYTFQCGSRAVLIAWAPRSEIADLSWLLTTPPGVDAYDIVGAPLSTGAVLLGDSPVYFTSSKLQAKDLAAACRLDLR